MDGGDRPDVYVTRRVPPKGVQLLREGCSVRQWDSDTPVPRAELVKQVKGARAIFCLLTDKIDAEVLDAAGVLL